MPRASTWVRCTSYGRAVARRATNPVGIVGRIDAGGKRDDLHVEALAVGELHSAERRRLPCGVAVEGERQLVREPPELPELLLGERRAHAGDDRLESGLPEGDHVGVPLDDDRAVVARDPGARLVEPVDDGALREELRLGRVHVLGLQRIVLVQPARLEAEDGPVRVREREHEPLLEVVVAVLAREPGRADLLGREALLAGAAARDGCRRSRARGGTRGSPPRRARARRGSRARTSRRASPRGSARRRPRRPRAARGAACGGCASRRLRARRPRTRGRSRRARQPFDRADEVESLRVADEADHVAALVAAVAVVELVHRVDREARRPLLVERAAADEPRARFPKRRALLDDRRRSRRAGARPRRCCP